MNKKGNAKLNFGTLGWILVVYCLLSFFFTSLLSSTLNLTSGLFSEMRGWDYAWLMSLVTIGGWVGVVALWVAGLFMGTGKLKIRPLIVICTVICGIAVIIWGYTNSIAVYSIMFIIYQVCYVLWAQLANNTLCSNWFPRKKGVLVGITTFGFPIGAGPGIAIFAALMGSMGIAKVFLLIGIIVMVIGIIGALVFTEFPEQRKRFPDNDKSMTREQADAELKEGLEMVKNSPWTTKRMLTTKETWFISLSNAIMLMFASGSILQVVPRLTAIGFTSDAATGMLTVAALVAVPGSFLCGLLDQKAGTKTAGNDNGSGSDFYLDGIRVMQPLNEDAALTDKALGAYAADGESNIDTITLRQKLITDHEQIVDPEAGETETEWPFAVMTDVDGAIVYASDYITIGPKEEVYLLPGQSVSFSVKYWHPDGYRMHMGMKAPFGTATVNVGQNQFALNNAADCYYDITGMQRSVVTETTEDGSSYYVATYTFTAVDKVVSLTNIKITGNYDFVLIEDTDVNVDGSEGDDGSSYSLRNPEEEEVVEEETTETPEVENTENETPEVENTENETPEVENTETETPDAESTETETPVVEDTETETPVVEDTETETPDAESTETETPDVENTNTETSDVVPTDVEETDAEA